MIPNLEIIVLIVDLLNIKSSYRKLNKNIFIHGVSDMERVNSNTIISK